MSMNNILDKSYYWKNGMYGPESILIVISVLCAICTIAPFTTILAKYFLVKKDKVSKINWNWKLILSLVPCFLLGVASLIVIIILYKAAHYFKIDQSDFLIPIFRKATIGMICLNIFCCLGNYLILYFCGKYFLFAVTEEKVYLFSHHFNLVGENKSEIILKDEIISFKTEDKKTKVVKLKANSWVGRKLIKSEIIK